MKVDHNHFVEDDVNARKGGVKMRLFCKIIHGRIIFYLKGGYD
jgi:hypothetical protein